MVEIKAVAEYNEQLDVVREQLALLERQKEIATGSIGFGERDAIFCPHCGAENDKNTDEDGKIIELKCSKCGESFWLKKKVETTYSTAIYKEALMQDDE